MSYKRKTVSKFPKKVYGIKHNNNIVYVGITGCSLELRFQLGWKGRIPYSVLNDCEMVVLDTIIDESEMVKERQWIKKYGIDNLYNTTKGCGFDNNEYQKENYKKLYENYYKEYWSKYHKTDKYRDRMRTYMRTYNKNK